MSAKNLNCKQFKRIYQSKQFSSTSDKSSVTVCHDSEIQNDSSLNKRPTVIKLDVKCVKL